MKSSILSIARDPEEARKQALKTIQNGEILLFPTETVYGLGVDSNQPAAIELLYKVKNRPREKPFQWLIANPVQARTHSRGWDERAGKLASEFWPGPLTLVVPTQDGTIGWRIPRHEWLLDLLRELGHPLVASSANRSGQPSLTTLKSAIKEFGDVIGLAVDGGNLETETASTVVSLETKEVRILREGAIPKAEILRILA